MQLDRIPAPRLNGRRLIATAVLGAVALTGAVATPARAQSAGGSKVGVVNVAVVSGKIQELKVFAARIKEEQSLMEASVQGHQAQIKMMQDKLGQMKPDSDQFEDQLTQAQEKAADFNKEDQLRKAQLLREVNKQNKTLFIEIQKVVADIAKQKGLDLVIVEPEVQLPVSVQNVDPQQLNNLISQKTVLYASPNIDLTEQVATALDADYKAHGGTVPAPAK